MSVFTTVTPEQIDAWLKRYSIGERVELLGIAAGIENTNYFLTTTRGRYVLTLFEKLTAEELPFYLGLMAHLARHGIPCAQPIADLDNAYFGTLNGKPAAIVTRVPGEDVKAPGVDRCAVIGATLAELHRAGASYQNKLSNPRGAAWRAQVAPKVLPFLDATCTQLLKEEIAFQSQQNFSALPQGAIHADLFRDNVLWEGCRVGGIIDFYFACTDALFYDVAIAVNDWCVESNGALNSERARALLNAYHAVRPITANEHAAWPALLRAGALRFWLSRLYDLHLPRAGELVHAHDPHHFERILRKHITDAEQLKHALPT